MNSVFKQIARLVCIVSVVLIATGASSSFAADRPVIAVVKTKPTPKGFAPRGSLLRDEPRPSATVTVAVPGGHRVLIADPSKLEDWYEVAVLDYPDEIRRGFLPKRDVKIVDMDQPFLDLHAKHWAFPAVKELSEAGLIQGAEEKFLGKKPFSRYEMAVVLARLVRQLRQAKGKLLRRVRTAYGSGKNRSAGSSKADASPSDASRMDEDLLVEGAGDEAEADGPPPWLGAYQGTQKGVELPAAAAAKADEAAVVKRESLEKRMLHTIVATRSVDRARVSRLEEKVQGLDGQMRQVKAWIDSTPRERRRMTSRGRKQRVASEELGRLEDAMRQLRAEVDRRLAAASSRLAKVDTVIPALAIERTRLASTKKDLDYISSLVHAQRRRLDRLEGRGL